MEISKAENNEINAFFNSQEFVEATILQLNKDLEGLSEIKLETSSSSDSVLSNLIFELALILKKLSQSNYSHLMQFIYRVDLAEKRFIESVQKDIELKQLALDIIEREAKKVYLRKRFSS